MGELTKTSYTLANYSIQAITGGTDAQGDVTVVLEHKGRRASARAADRAAFSPFKSTGRTSLAGPLVRSNMPRKGGVHEVVIHHSAADGFTPPDAPARPRPVTWSRP